MKFTIITFTILINSYSLNAQVNLVVNPSFEDTLDCDIVSNSNYLLRALNWFRPTGGSSDYFSDTQICSAGLNNGFGYQFPHTGMAYCGLSTINFGIVSFINYREYIEGSLTIPLTAGKKYCISFFISTADRSFVVTDKIGAYLSNDSLNDRNTSLILNVIPQIENINDNVITDTINWIPIVGTFVAKGGERFITIGNFRPDSLTNIDTLNYGDQNFAYYFIDDVSVFELPDLTITTANTSINKGDSIALQTTCSGCLNNMQYLWGPTLGLSNATIANPVASPTITTTYYLHLIDTGNITGCNNNLMDSITIIVKEIDTTQTRTIIIPNLISEGHWNIQNLPTQTTAIIYNSIGQIVFNTYDCKTNESFINLASGVYYFQLKTIDGVNYKGKLVVLK